LSIIFYYLTIFLKYVQNIAMNGKLKYRT